MQRHIMKNRRRTTVAKQRISYLATVLFCIFFTGIGLPAVFQNPDGLHVSTAPEEKGVTLLFAGDLLCHRYLQESGHLPDGGYDFSPLFREIRPLVEAADVAVLNQETLLAGEDFGLSGYPLFNAPTEMADALAECGFDVILQATNHALDRGEKGLLYCRNYWKTAHPEVLLTGGASAPEESDRVPILEKNGIKIAFLNMTYGTNGIPLPENAGYLIDLLQEDTAVRKIRKAREAADFVIVCPHWGEEYTTAISAEQKKYTALFLKEGVDLVVGTHPHVLQPVEEFTRPDGHRMTVFYSLGNLANSAAVTGTGICDRMIGGLAFLHIGKQENGCVTIDKADVIPTVTHLAPGYGGIVVYPLSAYSPALAEKNRFLRKRDPSFSYEYCLQHCRDILKEYVVL